MSITDQLKDQFPETMADAATVERFLRNPDVQKAMPKELRAPAIAYMFKLIMRVYGMDMPTQIDLAQTFHQSLQMQAALAGVIPEEQLTDLLSKALKGDQNG